MISFSPRESPIGDDYIVGLHRWGLKVFYLAMCNQENEWCCHRAAQTYTAAVRRQGDKPVGFPPIRQLANFCSHSNTHTNADKQLRVVWTQMDVMVEAKAGIYNDM